MTIQDKIRDKKLQYDINRKAANISAFSSGKIDRGKEILPYNRRQIIVKTKFAYSPLGKALEKQTEKQVVALNSINFSNKTDKLK